MTPKLSKELHRTSPSMKELYKRHGYIWSGTQSGLFSRKEATKRKVMLKRMMR